MTTQTRTNIADAIYAGGLQYQQGDSTWYLYREEQDAGRYILSRMPEWNAYKEEHDNLDDAIASAEEIAPLEQWTAAEW